MFSIELHVSRSPMPSAHGGTYEDVTTMLFEVCAVLSDVGAAEFCVSGFGQDRWPVDVRTDLPVILAQLPSAIWASASHAEIVLDFYEQGVERRLVFSPNGDGFDIACESSMRWTPTPTTERIVGADLHQQLVSIRNTFLALLRTIAPAMESSEILRAWVRQAKA